MLAPSTARAAFSAEPATNFDTLLSFAESLAATITGATSRQSAGVQVASFVAAEHKQESHSSFGDLLDESFALG